jgi:hypothetical protein
MKYEAYCNLDSPGGKPKSCRTSWPEMIFHLWFAGTYCISLNWSADGSTLYSGYTDGHIQVWGVGCL